MDDARALAAALFGPQTAQEPAQAPEPATAPVIPGQADRPAHRPQYEDREMSALLDLITTPANRRI